MGAHSRRTRPVALALALASGLVAAVPSPATAARAVFTQQTPVAVAEPRFDANGSSITINDNAAATPYPSNATVSGRQGVISEMTVYLDTFHHTFPDDVDIQLVGPGGQQVTLMSDAGSDLDVNGLLIFSDAGKPLPDSSQIDTFTDYHPTNYDGTATDGFTSPPSDGNTSLSVFNGTSPNGTWHLNVRDDVAAGTGSISSWILRIETDTGTYPSTVAVSGMPPAITDVNVSLHGLSSMVPSALDLLLVGPAGQQVTLMSDAGGSSAGVSDLDLTFDDEAANAPPADGPLVSGSFQPSNYGNGDLYFPPAPPSNGATQLSVFDGVDPDGPWQLFATSDTTGPSFSSFAGWSLDFEYADASPPSGSIAIASGAAAVGSRAVTLALAATDAVPGTGVTQMRFSNDGVAFGPYQPYAASAPWALPEGSGTKRVYAQFRDGAGNDSAVVSDTVVLDQTGPAARKTKPAKGAKDVKPGAKVKITVTEALQAATVTKAHVFLKKKGAHGKVKAKVTYDAVNHAIVVKPKKPLHGTYTVTVKGVRDALGNLWDQKPTKAGAQALKYTFSTD